MKVRILKLLKNRSSDLILIIAVFLVFFFTGKSTPFSGPAQKQTVTEPQAIENAIPEATLAPIENALPAINEIPPTEITKPMPVGKMFPNPVQMNPPIDTTQSPLADSLKSLKNNNPSTEDIVNRNAYFKKLTDQLNELQGESNSDSSGNTNSNLPTQVYPNDLPVDEESDQQESLGDEAEEEELPENPYLDLQTTNIPPPIIQ